MARCKAKKRGYKLIGFKAYTDTDADLLAWWEGIAPGQRSDALRDLLRLVPGSSDSHFTVQIRVRGRRVRVWRIKAALFNGDIGDFMSVYATACSVRPSSPLFPQNDNLRRHSTTMHRDTDQYSNQNSENKVRKRPSEVSYILRYVILESCYSGASITVTAFTSNIMIAFVN